MMLRSRQSYLKNNKRIWWLLERVQRTRDNDLLIELIKRLIDERIYEASLELKAKR